MDAYSDHAMKWSLPGWRIEQRYSNKVLIGNWVEERKKPWGKYSICDEGRRIPNLPVLVGTFRRRDGERPWMFIRNSLPKSKSCYEKDYVQFSDSKPDWIQRRYFLKRMEGLPGHHLLSHHGEQSPRHLVSQYDDHYVRRGNSTLPPLRSWDGNSLTWAPEKSDFPTAEPPTNFGLLQEKKKLWKDEVSEDLRSVYSASYRQPPTSAFMTTRYGVAPRVLSSTMHQPNNTNKALDFKCQAYLQVPDKPVVRPSDNFATEEKS